MRLNTSLYSPSDFIFINGAICNIKQWGVLSEYISIYSDDTIMMDIAKEILWNVWSIDSVVGKYFEAGAEYKKAKSQAYKLLSAFTCDIVYNKLDRAVIRAYSKNINIEKCLSLINYDRGISKKELIEYLSILQRNSNSSGDKERMLGFKIKWHEVYGNLDDLTDLSGCIIATFVKNWNSKGYIASVKF